MRGSKLKTLLAPVLFAAMPLALACEPGEQEGQPGMQEQQPGQQQPGQQPPAQQPPTADVSDDELRNFAEVYVALNEVEGDLQAGLQEAETPEEETQVQEQASQDMEAVLEEYDMGVQEYQEMVQLVNTDPQLRADFQELVQDMSG